MNELNTTKKPFYKKWWFITSAAIIVIVAIAGGGGGKSESVSADAKTEVATPEKKATSITGSWYNSGEYGENKLQILSPDNFIYTNPIGEKLFGKWINTYGNSYILTYSDGSEQEASLNDDVLDFVGSDWKKK